MGIVAMCLYKKWENKTMTIKQQLENIYLDYFNNYLTLETMAEHNEIELGQLALLVEWGRQIHNGYIVLY